LLSLLPFGFRPGGGKANSYKASGSETSKSTLLFNYAWSADALYPAPGCTIKERGSIEENSLLIYFIIFHI